MVKIKLLLFIHSPPEREQRPSQDDQMAGFESMPVFTFSWQCEVSDLKISSACCCRPVILHRTRFPMVKFSCRPANSIFNPHISVICTRATHDLPHRTLSA